MSNSVLIVEDDPDILSSLAEVIRDEGYEVQTAANGYQALATMAMNQPDLIFLDLMMPVMDGWKFMEEMRHRFPTLDIPVVLVSAIHGLTEEARRLGVQYFLEKPFELEEVARLAHECCDGKLERDSRREPPP